MFKPVCFCPALLNQVYAHEWAFSKIHAALLNISGRNGNSKTPAIATTIKSGTGLVASSRFASSARCEMSRLGPQFPAQ